MTMVSQALETLTSMSATARLQTKKYMGEWRFLFFTMAQMTRMFSSRLMMPRMRNISVAMLSCSHALGLLWDGVSVALRKYETGLELTWMDQRDRVASELFIVDEGFSGNVVGFSWSHWVGGLGIFNLCKMK